LVETTKRQLSQRDRIATSQGLESAISIQLAMPSLFFVSVAVLLAVLFQACTAFQSERTVPLIFMLSRDCEPGTCQDKVSAELSKSCTGVHVKPTLQMVSASCPGKDIEDAGQRILDSVEDIRSFEQDFPVTVEF
jgi:hypothetical protein